MPNKPSLDIIKPGHRPEGQSCRPHALPKPHPCPRFPPPRMDDLQAFESYRDDYDVRLSSHPAPRSAPSKAAQTKAAEWIEVKAQPNHRRGIINLDYATVASSEQVRNTAAQVTQAQNRTPQGGPQNAQRIAQLPTKRSSRLYEMVARKVRQRKTLSVLSPQHSSSSPPATKIEQLTKHAIVLSWRLVGLEIGQEGTQEAKRQLQLSQRPATSPMNKSCSSNTFSWNI
jgi:hypothetical protein